MPEDRDREPTVNYSVKEILAQMDRRADERHEENKREFRRVKTQIADIVRDRIEPLERDRTKRVAISNGVNKAWVIAIAALGVLMNIPAVLFYIHG